jgi:hypothetical protein
VALGALAASLLIRRAARPARALWLSILPLACLALAALWPYYPVLGLLRAFTIPALRVPVMPLPGGGLENAPPLPVLETLGPAALGILGCLRLAGRREPFLLLWAGADLLLGALPLVPLHQRFLFFAALPLQIGATEVLDSAWRKGGLARGAALLLLGAGAFSAGRRAQWLLEQERPDLAFVERLTPENAVVLSDPATANGIAALSGRKVVVPNHPDLFLMMDDGGERLRQVYEFLRPATSADEREAILKRWHVTHVLVDRIRDPALPPLPYPVLHDDGGYLLYEVRR